MAGTNRLPRGGRIDRAKPVSIRFNGRTLGGFAGDTVGTPDAGLTYGEARQKIRRLVALRGLKSA